MRISDWSSDVCSSDLKIATMLFVPPEKGEAFWTESARTAFVGIASWIAAKPERPFSFGEIHRTITMPGMKAFFAKEAGDRDRTSVVQGKSGPVRVDLRGRRRSKKKHHHTRGQK